MSMPPSLRTTVLTYLLVAILAALPACGSDSVDNDDATDDDAADDDATDDDAAEECSTGCLVAGGCYAEGMRNPANVCLVCDATANAGDWTEDDGASCDDGQFCTLNDICDGGTCAGTSRDCSDGVTCNGAESCDESAGRCAAAASTCGAGELCDASTDSCVHTCTGCVIADVCYGDGQLAPTNPCLRCDVTQSTTAFSDNDGASCDDGTFCNGEDQCGGGTCSVPAGDPCASAGESCFEAEERCCVPALYQACNGSDDVASYDSCAREEAVVDDCPDTNGTCVAGSCGCAEGFTGDDCARCVIYVDGADGDDGESGATWALAKATIQSGIDAAAPSGCEVWVSMGVYGETLTLADGVAVRGGFLQGDLSPALRAPTDRTTVDGDGAGPVVTCDTLSGCGSDAALSELVITGGAGILGGGMTIAGASPSLTACDFIDNTALHGGGLYVDSGAPRIHASTFLHNTTNAGADGTGGSASTGADGDDAGHGAAIYLVSSLGTRITDTVFADNRAGAGGTGEMARDSGDGGSGGSGGAVYAVSSTAQFVGCRFEDNAAGDGGQSGVANSLNEAALGGAGGSGGSGGAIFFDEATIAISRCAFLRNRAGQGGGSAGTYAETTGNVAEATGGPGGSGGSGGALRGTPSSSLDVTNTIFFGNRAGEGGAGGDATATLPGAGACFAFAGPGGRGGSGGAVSDAGAFNLASSTAVDNERGAAGSGGRAAGSIVSCSGVDGPNGASGSGGGIDSTGATVTNSIVWGNAGTQISDGTAAVQSTDVEGGFAGTGNLDVDPGFRSTALHAPDLRLNAMSPVADMGDNSLLPMDTLDLDGDLDMSEALPLDLAGNPRVANATVDMGAYETP